MTKDSLDAAKKCLIGKRRDQVPTPSLILDLPKVRKNIAEMARRMAPLPAALRPHAKIHKNPGLGKMQIAAGAIGLTTATAWEAAAMVDAGLTNILIANQVVGAAKVADLARIAGLAQVIVEVESVYNANELSEAAVGAGSRIDVLVEIDVGLHRAGVRSTEEALALGAHITKLPGLRLQGVLGYEGHSMLEPNRAVRIEKTLAANAALIAVADEFDRDGLDTTIVAAGGFGTWDITGANARITEIHAGSYIFNDAFHRNLMPGFETALTVAATVTSRTGGNAVVDCGRKSIGIDRAVPELLGNVGEIKFDHGEFAIHEEHIVLTLRENSDLAVGDRVELLPGYAPTTVNLYDIYCVVEDDVVIDVWPIEARYGRNTVGIGLN
jgi:D-serine deaminase-like pyridoxal phosphate-dependent protein